MTGVRKQITVEYQKDAQGPYTATSPDLHQAFDRARTPAGNALVTQAPTLGQIMINTSNCIDLILEDAGYTERAADLTIHYKCVP